MTDFLDDARRALQEGRRSDALAIVDALATRPLRDVHAARTYAMFCSELGHAGIERAWRQLLELAPGDPEAHYALGSAAGDRGDFAAAAEHFRTALVRAPGHPQLTASLGLALEESGNLEEAEACFRRALSGLRAPPYPLLANLARILFRQHRYGDALSLFETLAAKFGIAEPLLNAAHAVCLAHAGRDDEAESAFRRALAQDASAPGIARDHAAFLMRRERYADAAVVLEQASAGDGQDLLATSMLLACRLHLADWHDVGALRTRVIDRVAAGLIGPADVVPGYDFLAVCDDPLLQRAAAQSWARGEAPEVVPSPPNARKDPARLRLGFVSSDFGNHPVGRLVVGLLERIDRTRFDVFAYATARETGGEFRARIERNVNRYRLLDRGDPDGCARALRADALDVLVDLNGFSGGEAIRFFARRPAPVQINFLGYTGTLGTSAYDFIIVDRYCAPRECQDAFAERMLYVDPCYLPSVPARAPQIAAPSRTEYGLSDDAFVFCAFAAAYKILPDLFDCWMQLLRDVQGSVLWLRHLPPDRIARLRGEALRRGVDDARLIVAPADSVARYLARFGLADLMLDSAPFGSHTTVNDALFAGLPVVTIAGQSFAGRASASQLHAAGFPELIARDADDYTSIARSLARDRERLTQITQRLRESGRHSPLFDMSAYARAFESAIERAVDTAAARASA